MRIFENFWKTSEKVQKCFSDVFKWFFEIFGKSSEVFGNHRTFSEKFGNGSKLFFRRFYYFLKFRKIWKSSEVFENHRTISGRDRGVEKFQTWFLRSPQRTPVICCAQVVRESRVEYYPLHITRCIPQNMQRQSWPLIGCIFQDKRKYNTIRYDTTYIQYATMQYYTIHYSYCNQGQQGIRNRTIPHTVVH